MDIKTLRTENKTLVLEIGPNQKPQAQFVPEYKDAKIITLDIDAEQKPDIVCDAGQLPGELDGLLDGVFASHVLEHFSYWQTVQVLKGWIKTLKPGGALHVAVPSWEWSAREVLAENPSPALYAHTFAGQINEHDAHLSMFTMRRLRALFEQCGLSVTRARTGIYHLVAADGQLHEAEQHYICGVKGAPPLEKE